MNGNRERLKPSRSVATQRQPAFTEVSSILGQPFPLPTIARCACGGSCPRCQANSDSSNAPRVSQPSDPAEREADHVADQVMRMPNPTFSSSIAPTKPVIQRKCKECEAEEEKLIQTKRESPSSATTAFDVGTATRAARQGGARLTSEVRSYFEPRFGQDFSHVRVHTGSEAAGGAQAIRARAYTIGRDIVFGAGEYAPGSHEGRKLLAHELAHVAQTRGPGEIHRQAAGGAAAAVNPCTMANCAGRTNGIQNDLNRAISYTTRAIAALTGTRDGATNRALNWYFNSASDATAATVRQRLTCIQNALQDSLTNNRFCCDNVGLGQAIAYVRVGQPAPCVDAFVDVSLVTNSYFGLSDRIRAEVLIHECAHRVGMSVGGPTSTDDIYDFTWRFMGLDTVEALLNSDSYALFAGGIVNGIRTTILLSPSLSGGGAATAGGRETWYGRFYFGAEFQHPILRFFNPTLGFSFSLIGDPQSSSTRPGTAGAPSLLTSVVAGVRITDPRPGSRGSPYLNLFGGPSLALNLNASRPSLTGLGAEAGVGVGYRWRWLDVGVTGGVFYDPTRDPGSQHLFYGGLSITASGFTFLPGSH
jgi:hypothetical protein